MAVIGSLSVKLGLVTVEWDKATDKAKKQAKDLQGAFNDLGKNLQGLSKTFNSLGGGLSLSVIGFTALARSTLSYANDIKDLSEGFDISIGKTLQFRHAIEVSGGSAEGASRMLSTLFSKLSEAQKGVPASIRAFEDLGITWKELQNLSPEQAINRVFEALANGAGDNTFKRIESIKELLGKKGVQLNVKDVNDLLHQTTAEYEQHAKNIKKIGEANDALKTSMDNLKIAMADMLSPFLNKDLEVSINAFKAGILAIASAATVGFLIEVAGAIIKIYTALEKGAKVEAALQALQGGKGLAKLAVGAATYYLAKKAFDLDTQNAVQSPSNQNQYGSVNNSLGGNITPNFGGAGDKGKDAPSVVALKEQIKLIKEMMGLEHDEAMIKVAAQWTDEYSIKNREIQLNKQKEINKAKDEYVKYIATERHTDEELASAKIKLGAQTAEINQKALDAQVQLNNELQRELFLLQMQDQLKKDTSVLDMATYDLQQRKSEMSDYEFNVENEKLSLAKKMISLQEKLNELKQPDRNDKASVDHYNALRQSILDEMSIEQEMSDNRTKWYSIEEEHRQSFSYGWNQAWMQYERDAQDASKRGAQAFQTVTDTMSKALDEFVQTGKISFRSLIGDMIKQLLKLQMQAQLSGLFGMLGKFLGLGGSGSNIGGAATGGINFSSFGNPLTTLEFADGGNPPVGKASLVGENGPELFIPKTAGTIIPNNSLSSMMGSQPQVVYNGPYIANMSAIDTQSSVQFLAKNKQAVWSANQSAQRSLPQSR